jgi:hypothetical protein
MDRTTQLASLHWLQDRLQADEDERIATERRGIDKMTRRERAQLSAVVGDAAVKLIGTMMIAGGVRAHRKCEVMGPLAADVTVTVEKR